MRKLQLQRVCLEAVREMLKWASCQCHHKSDWRVYPGLSVWERQKAGLRRWRAHFQMHSRQSGWIKTFYNCNSCSTKVRLVHRSSSSNYQCGGGLGTRQPSPDRVGVSPRVCETMSTPYWWRTGFATPSIYPSIQGRRDGLLENYPSWQGAGDRVQPGQVARLPQD